MTKKREPKATPAPTPAPEPTPTPEVTHYGWLVQAVKGDVETDLGRYDTFEEAERAALSAAVSGIAAGGFITLVPITEKPDAV